MVKQLVDELPQVEIRYPRIDLADEVLVEPVRFFDLETYALDGVS